MARLTKLSLFLILYYSAAQLLTHSLATTSPNAHNATDDDDDNISLCRDTDTWIRPSWPADIYSLCEALIDEFYASEPEILMSHPPLHEFLPVGIQRFFPELPDPVRTPWRLTKGACTLAVTTLHSVPRGYLPAEIRAKGPFPLEGTSWWWNIWDDALEYVLHECVMRGKAGMTWNKDRSAIGVFLFATGSAMDQVLGVSPEDGVVGMGGVNGSANAVMAMNGTGDAVMEDVEAAKSRRGFRKGLVS